MALSSSAQKLLGLHLAVNLRRPGSARDRTNTNHKQGMHLEIASGRLRIPYRMPGIKPSWQCAIKHLTHCAITLCLTLENLFDEITTMFYVNLLFCLME